MNVRRQTSDVLRLIWVNTIPMPHTLLFRLRPARTLVPSRSFFFLYDPDSLEQPLVHRSRNVRRGILPIEDDGLPQRIKIRTAVGALRNMFSDLAAPRGIQILIKICANIEIHVTAFHARPSRCEVMYGSSCSRKNARALRNRDFAAS